MGTDYDDRAHYPPLVGLAHEINTYPDPGIAYFAPRAHATFVPWAGSDIAVVAASLRMLIGQAGPGLRSRSEPATGGASQVPSKTTRIEVHPNPLSSSSC